MAGINSVAAGAAHNYGAVISNSVATATEANFQMPLQFDCTVQSVKVHFPTPPSATVNAASILTSPYARTARIRVDLSDCAVRRPIPLYQCHDGGDGTSRTCSRWDLVPIKWYEAR